jgi:hypothetical protein
MDALKIVLSEEFDNTNEGYNSTREPSIDMAVLNDNMIKQIVENKIKLSKLKLRSIGFFMCLVTF